MMEVLKKHSQYDVKIDFEELHRIVYSIMWYIVMVDLPHYRMLYPKASIDAFTDNIIDIPNCDFNGMYRLFSYRLFSGFCDLAGEEYRDHKDIQLSGMIKKYWEGK